MLQRPFILMLALILIGPTFTNQSSAAAADITITCRVVDTSGQPISGATVSVRTIAPVDPNTGKSSLEDTVESLDPSDANGVVKTGALKSGRSHVLEFSRDGYVPKCSRRSHTEASGTVEFPDVVLRRLRTVSGIVVDTEGRPLQDVRLTQAGDGPVWTETLSAADGTFQLAGVPEGLALVFARLDGYWFTGKRASLGKEPLRFELTPRSQPNPEQCDVNLKTTSKAETPESAAPTVEVLVESIRKASDEGSRAIKFSLWQSLAKLNEVRAMLLLDELDFSASDRSFVFQQRVPVEMKEDFQNGMARLMEFEKPEDRASIVLYYILRLVPLELEQKQTLLAQAVTDLRSIQDPLSRVGLTALIFRPLSKIGANDTVKQLVDESVALLEKSGDSPAIQSTYGTLAEQLAPVDPDRALLLADRAAPMFSAWIATGIARHNPVKATEMFRAYQYSGTGGSRLGHWYNVPRAGYNMAFADVDAALAIAELSNGITGERVAFSAYKPVAFGGKGLKKSNAADLFGSAASIISAAIPGTDDASIDPVVVLLKARTYGLIVKAITKTDSPRARAIIEQAAAMIEPLRDGVQNQRGGFNYPPSNFMASLIPTASEIDPGLAAELCWRTQALRWPMSGHDDAEASTMDSAHLIELISLATLDISLAEDLTEPIGNRMAERSYDGISTPFWMVYTLFRINPDRCKNWAETLGDQGFNEATSPRESALKIMITMQGQSEVGQSRPIMKQAAQWIDSTMWLDGIVDDE